jgi:hypothetical protein
VFRDDSREWPELKAAQRFEFVFPTTVLGYFGGLVVTLFVAIPQMADAGERNMALGAVALLMMLPWVPYFLKRQTAIKESVARFSRRQSLQEGIQIILPE